MRFFALFVALGLLTPCALPAQTSSQQTKKTVPKSASSEQVQTEQIQTEKITVPQYLQAPPHSMANQPGYMEPAQTRALLAKLWQAEQRVKDLVTQVQPKQLKMPAAAVALFKNNLAVLGQNLNALEKSRAQFDGRVDSEYLGFETYAGISEVLPSLERLTATLSHYDNPSLEGEFNQAWDDMLTMQQALKPYLAFLLRNHDKIFLTMEMNLAGCQRRLGYTQHGSAGPTKNMRNILPAFKGRRVNKKPETNETAPNSKQ